MHEYIGTDPRLVFDPIPGRAAIYQPIGRSPVVCRIVSVNRARNAAVITYPRSPQPSRQHPVKLEHLRKP